MAYKHERRKVIKRIDKYHLSLWEFMSASSRAHNDKERAKELDDKVSIYTSAFRIGPMLLGVFQPFVDMINDGIDTFRHYKTLEEIRDDALQPIYGLGNILKALFTIIAIPFSLILGTIVIAIPDETRDRHDPKRANAGYRIGVHLLQLLTLIPHAVFTLARGITQIIFTPLTWFLKMPLRGIITAVKGKGLERQKARKKSGKILRPEEIYYQFERRQRNRPQDEQQPRRRGLPRIRKINRSYVSVFEMLSMFNLPIFSHIARRFYRHEFVIAEDGRIFFVARTTRAHNPPTNIGYWLLSAFQPFVDMAKDVANLGYGYKSTRHVLKDLAQPLRGVGNIIKSLLTPVVIPLFLIGIIIAAFVPWNPQTKPFKARMLLSLFLGTLLWIPNAAFTFVRGLTQIIFTPLSWLKMALRGILSRKGYQSLKDDRGVRQLINDSESTKKIVRVMNNQTKENDFIYDEARYLTSVDNELERKARKAQARGRTLPEKLTKMLAEPKPEPVQQYVAENGSGDEQVDALAQTPTQEKVTSVPSDAVLAGPEKYRYLTFFKSWIDAPEEKVPNQRKGADESSPLVYDGR